MREERSEVIRPLKEEPFPPVQYVQVIIRLKAKRIVTE